MESNFFTKDNMNDECYARELELLHKKKREKAGLVTISSINRNKNNNNNRKKSKTKLNSSINENKSYSVVVNVLNETKKRANNSSNKSLGSTAIKKLVLHGNFIHKLKEVMKKGKRNKKVTNNESSSSDNTFTSVYSLNQKDDYTACPTSMSTKKHSNCFYRMKL